MYAAPTDASAIGNVHVLFPAAPRRAAVPPARLLVALLAPCGRPRAPACRARRLPPGRNRRIGAPACRARRLPPGRNRRIGAPACRARRLPPGRNRRIGDFPRQEARRLRSVGRASPTSALRPTPGPSRLRSAQRRRRPKAIMSTRPTCLLRRKCRRRCRRCRRRCRRCRIRCRNRRRRWRRRPRRCWRRRRKRCWRRRSRRLSRRRVAPREVIAARRATAAAGQREGGSVGGNGGGASGASPSGRGSSGSSAKRTPGSLAAAARILSAGRRRSGEGRWASRPPRA